MKLPPELEAGKVTMGSKAAGGDTATQKAGKREGGQNRTSGQAAAKRAKVHLQDTVINAFLRCCKPVAMQGTNMAPLPLKSAVCDLHTGSIPCVCVSCCIVNCTTRNTDKVLPYTHYNYTLSEHSLVAGWGPRRKAGR